MGVSKNWSNFDTSKLGCISFTFAPTEQEWYKCEGNLNGTMFHTRGSL